MAQVDATTFDPYYKWLSIPPHEQPPNHYRLLGVALFEEDPEVIAAAADRQMGHIKSYTNGRYASHSQRLLTELAKARICLLNAERKASYDAQLKRETALREGVEQQIPQRTPSAAALPVEIRSVDQQSTVPAILVASPRDITRRSQPRQQFVLVLIMLLVGAVAALLAFQNDAKDSTFVSKLSKPLEIKEKEPSVLGNSRPARVGADRSDIVLPESRPPQKSRPRIEIDPAPRVAPPPQNKPIPKVVHDVPSEVTLPPIEGPSFRLAGLPQDQIGNLQLKLVTLDQPGKVTQLYFFIPRKGMGEAWEVYFDSEDAQRLLQQGGPLPEGVPHARFTYEHGELFFGWLPAAVKNASAANLRNSVLEIRGNDLAEEIQLRNTVVDDAPILVGGWKDFLTWRIECRDLDPLPRDEHLLLEIDTRNFPRLTLIEGKPDASAESEKLKWTIGNHRFAGLAVTWERRGQNLRVHIGPAYELASFPDRLYLLSPKQVEAHETNLSSRLRSSETARQQAQKKLEMLRNNLSEAQRITPRNSSERAAKQATIEQINNRIAPLPEQIKELDQRIANCSADLRDRIEPLKSLAAEIDGKAEIGFRFYSLVGEHKLTIYEKGFRRPVDK